MTRTTLGYLIPPDTTDGDLLVREDGEWKRLPLGTPGSMLSVGNTNSPEWVEPVGWTSVALNTGWSHYTTAPYGGVQYSRDALGRVHLRGVASKANNGSSSAVMVQLPAGFRPGGRTHLFLQYSNPTGTACPARVNIHPDGNVEIPLLMAVGGGIPVGASTVISSISFDGISF